jgi:hypothetical protein
MPARLRDPLPAVLVAVSIGVTVPESALATWAVLTPGASKLTNKHFTPGSTAVRSDEQNHRIPALGTAV